jgi:hypothetical protein
MHSGIELFEGKTSSPGFLTGVYRRRDVNCTQPELEIDLVR